MFRSTANLTIDTKISDEKRLICSWGMKNYRVMGYIDVDVYFEDTKVGLLLNSLWDILASQGLLESFRSDTLKCIEELKDDFSKKCKGKVLDRDIKPCVHFEDVCIEYDTSGKNSHRFCITVCAKDGLQNLEKYWNDFLDIEWEKYKSKEEDRERDIE